MIVRNQRRPGVQIELVVFFCSAAQGGPAGLVASVFEAMKLDMKAQYYWSLGRFSPHPSSSRYPPASV